MHELAAGKFCAKELVVTRTKKTETQILMVSDKCFTHFAFRGKEVDEINKLGIKGSFKK